MAMANLTGRKATGAVRKKGIPIITFTLGDEWYGFHISRVREVVRHLPVTRIPRSPAYMPGIINLRGGVVTVIDLGMRFGLAPVKQPDEAFILVAEIEHEDSRYLLGLRVDQVQEVVMVDPDQMDASPRIGGLVASDYVEGIFLRDGAFVSVLSMDRAFDLSDLLRASSPEVLEANSLTGAQPGSLPAKDAPATGQGG